MGLGWVGVGLSVRIGGGMQGLSQADGTRHNKVSDLDIHCFSLALSVHCSSFALAVDF